MNQNSELLRNIGIASILCASIFLAIYVSIPDFPYDCPAWGFLLWGEPSQWWSEITWIGGFCVLSILAIMLWSYNSDLSPNNEVRFYHMAARLCWVSSVIPMMIHYTAFYFSWTSWPRWVLRDDTGYLHGFFYILTFFIGVLAFIEGMGYLARVHERVMRL